MGIEEYRFLTKTMEQIADCSSQLETLKNEESEKATRFRYLEVVLTTLFGIRKWEVLLSLQLSISTFI